MNTKVLRLTCVHVPADHSTANYASALEELECILSRPLRGALFVGKLVVHLIGMDGNAGIQCTDTEDVHIGPHTTGVTGPTSSL